MLRATPLILLPAAAFLTPVLAIAFPAMRHPIVAVPRRLPVAGHPVMTMARPAPEPANPDLTDNRRPSDIFNPRRRWRHNHRFAVVVTIIVVRPIGGDDRTAAGDCSSGQQDPQDSVFHSRAFRYCDEVCAINVSLSERPTQPAVLYKLLQFPVHAPIVDLAPCGDCFPGASGQSWLLDGSPSLDRTQCISAGKSLTRPSDMTSTAMAARMRPIRRVMTLIPVWPMNFPIRPAAESASHVARPMTRP